jgi:taurine dioxygenase
MKFTPMSEHVGSEVTDMQLASVDADAIKQIKAQLAERGMLHFRDQELTPEQHIAFAKSWGGIDVNPFFPVNSGYPEIAEVRKAEEQTTNIGGGWHTDHSFDPVPSMGSILVARELPPSGGDTLFASMGAAWDALSPGLQATLRTLRAVHSADHIYAPDGYYSTTDMAGEMRGQDVKTGAVHPIAIQHPVTGRTLLYVNGAFTQHIEGWTREESEPLLHYLYANAAREEFQCRIEWKPGSVAIWDNRSTWHWAMNDYHGHRRVMHRITLSGEELKAA